MQKMYVSHVPDSQAWEQRGSGQLWVLSSGPHPSGDSTDDHLQVQNHHDWVARDVLVLGSGESVHKTSSKTSLVGESVDSTFSNRLHNKIVYLDFHVWHLESDMNI